MENLKKASVILLAAGILAIGVSGCGNNSAAGENDSKSTANVSSKVAGYLATAPDSSWVIFLDPAGGIVNTASYSDGSKIGESGKPQVNVEHGTIDRYSAESVDFIGIDLAVLKSCPCRMITSGSNLQILVPTNNGLETISFYPSNVVAYNSSVAELNKRVAQINLDNQQAAANAQAAQQAHEQQVLAKEQATCAQVGGKWYSNANTLYSDQPVCSVLYDNSAYTVDFDDEGNVVPLFGDSPESCAAKFPVNTWRWHSDTQICE